MANTYDIGDIVRVAAAFTDPNAGDAPIDPTAVSFIFKDPDGVITTRVFGVDAIVKDSIGVYHSDIEITTAGRWFYRWESTGTGQSAAENYFGVRLSNI